MAANPWEMNWGQPQQGDQKPWEQDWSGQAPQPNIAPAGSIPSQIMDAIGNTSDVAMNTLYQAESPFWHTLGKLVTGPAQLINNGMAKLTSLTGNNPVSRSFQEMANLTNDFVNQNEQKYQAANPPSLGKKLGTIDAYALPFMFSAPSRLLGASGELLPSIASKFRIPMTTLNASKNVVPNLASRILNSSTQAATYGLMQPVTGNDYWGEKGKQVAGSAAFGAALPILGAGISGIWGIGKGLKAGVVDPLANKDKIIAHKLLNTVNPESPDVMGNTLLRAVGNNGATDILSTNPASPYIPGVKFSAAESTGNQGLAALEDAYKAQNAGGILNQQAASNRQVLAKSIRNIAKDEIAKTAAESAREKAVSSLYDEAKQAVVPATKELNSILSTPAGQEAKRMADQKFANIRATGKTNGIPESAGVIVDESGHPFITNPEIPPEYHGAYLHEIKLGLDKLSRLNPQNPADASKLSGVDDVRNAFNAWIENNIPPYGQAKSTYSAMSRPINKMEIGTVLQNKLLPATSGDIPTSLNAASLARALQNPDALAAYATGYPRANFNQIMGPETTSTINGINKDASRIAEINRLGAGFGSPTARRLGANDFLSGYFATHAPGANKALNTAANMPGLRTVGGATAKFGNMLKKQIDADLASRLEEILANNDHDQIRALLEQAAKSQAPKKSTMKELLSKHPFTKNFVGQ